MKFQFFRGNLSFDELKSHSVAITVLPSCVEGNTGETRWESGHGRRGEFFRSTIPPPFTPCTEAARPHAPIDQNFQKFQFKIKWNRKFLNLFEKFGQVLDVILSSEIWKFPVPFGISTHYKLALVPLLMNFALTKATRWQ